jgi:uncharacterized protein YPO0396
METTSQDPMESDTASTSVQTSYVLHELEVYNWGPFSGLHRAVIDPRGTAVIGPTGSGKTTLIDALMTLIVSQPRYNLASTGGHESDRTLISYVRGVLSGDGANEREEIARSGSTLTGLCAIYRGGENETLRLGAVLWTDGASNAATDLKRRWIFSLNENESLEQWLRLVHDDGVRLLMNHGRDTERTRIFESKKQYLAHVQKFFDVGDNAFTLLNRAAGLKQLNSIDEIFRDLVLDDRSAFDRALEVAGEFDNLVGIHRELEIARDQQRSLVPIAEQFKKLEKVRETTSSSIYLKQILPIWFAMAGERLWVERIAALTVDHERKFELQETEDRREIDSERRVNTLRESYLKLGGNVIGELENTISEQKKRVGETKKRAGEYLGAVRRFRLDEELSRAALSRNQAALVNQRVEMVKRREDKLEETLEARSQLRDEETKASEAEESLRKVRERPGSNIPPNFQDFRAALADWLALRDEDLPFVAELIEVKQEESAWRGAIERAIGSERLRILVPADRLDAALRWVNDRDNKLHVRLQRAGNERQPSDFFTDGFTRKLNFKPHPLRETLKCLLAGRDRHCVTSPDALKNLDHGMTITGLMSDRQGRFEKQDNRPMNQGWMTGFDNQDQLRALAAALAAHKRLAGEWTETVRHHQTKLTEYEQLLILIDGLATLEFSTIDLPGAEADLASSEARLAALLDPNSDASRAKMEFDQAAVELSSIRDLLRKLEGEIAVMKSNITTAEQERDKAIQRVGAGLDDEDKALAESRLTIPTELSARDLDDEERTKRIELEDQIAKESDHIQDLERRIIALMVKALALDTGALAETGSDLQDIPDYLERLRVLNEEALPEKLTRFLEYLNRSSDQGVTQLVAGIREEVDGIEHRIADLNLTLAKVDFRSGRFLQLQPKRVVHERLRSLDNAQRHLRSAALREDQGESHYKALKAVIEILREAGENRRQLGSRALLDPRYRLEFAVVEVDRITGTRSAPRTGSQSGSGGEKELMASHILTASLSYALCPNEAGRPLYGTVVLDEAFSKSSPSAAGRIIEALRIFGLHPIFVTPNKEIGLLRKHTRRVVCVHRIGKEASLASISWEKLEELAQSQ